MKSQIFRRLIHLAAAILLFVIASQCPYSPYGALTVNAMEKRNESSSDVPTNINPIVEEIFLHDKSPISFVRGEASAALPQAAAFFDVSELFNSFL